MCLKRQWWSGLVAAMLGGLVGVTAAAGAQFLPILGVREGALRSTQLPLANGFIDYVTLLNERDGGINGVTLVWEECETVWDVTRGVECYERLKVKGPTGAAAMQLANAALGYALLERATHDQIPLLTPGFGHSGAADGRVFPYVFPAPSTYWSQNTAKLRFIGQRVGGLEQLKGLKIVHVYLDEAVEYYNTESPGLREQFLLEVLRTLERIRQYQEAWHPFSQNTRRCQTRRFPYGVVYQILESELLVIAIAHLHREPGYWRDRI